MKEAIQLITHLAIAKFRAGEITEQELRSVLDECVQTAREHGVLAPCFEEERA